MPRNHLLELRVARALLALRLGSALVMFVWAAHKIVKPSHAAEVFEKFYSLGELRAASVAAIGIAELILVLLFVVGYLRTLTYSSVFVVQLVSALSAWAQYADPWNDSNRLYFLSWPLLAALFALLYLRHYDRILSVDAVFSNPRAETGEL